MKEIHGEAEQLKLIVMSELVILLDEGVLNYSDLKYAFSHLNNQIIAKSHKWKMHDLDIIYKCKG